LNTSHDPTGAVAGTVVSCDVLAHGLARGTTAELAALRQNQEVVPLAPSLLKHADDQTVAALAAVFGAVRTAGLDPGSFASWAVLAAPRFLGRVAMHATLQRFRTEGAWGISPHLIPHRSLHSVSGTISQALKIHGPNYGVGGGPGSWSEGFLTAAALVGDSQVPGVWLVLTGWEPEHAPTLTGAANPSAVCGAVALALVSARPDCDRPGAPLQLRVRMGPCAPGQPAPGTAVNPVNLETLLHALRPSGCPPELPRTTVVWQLERGGWLELREVGVGVGEDLADRSAGKVESGLQEARQQS
jgi:hypothetical protein